MQTNNTAPIDMIDVRAHVEWYARACPNGACASDSWVVQRVPGVGDLWRVARHPDDAPALVAATDPCCPRCGSTLAITLELPSTPQPSNRFVLRWAQR